MPFSIATWNINSVRLRMPLVEQFLKAHQPDVLCLQEIKCENGQFPEAAFRALGYEHLAVNGQKGYHGVATVARRPIRVVERREFCAMGDCRHISVTVGTGSRDILLHNFYVPAGGDEPDPAINPKFRHKLDFLDEMRSILADHGEGQSSVLVGDLNIAPLENDVWSHKALLKIVSHTPLETETLEDLRLKGGWSDLMRQRIPPEDKLYTWWSYRAKDWDGADKGRRLDHVWSSPDLEPFLNDISVLRAARGWEKPSDHVPVIATFDLD
ncbi:exodeoxyribonuclease III [Zhengella mangrovi]|uniref:Exodeoxyribonuclease III n=1 Tax=Zhengella mangrovi TaxID=1982044 RepID=A0A2G1QSI6_9HYPH|nr:exodeoxyribonuclease III [Zhengella mangrovi]PHP68507.1 exodeoxyribonuclease III [Zhengella mangrovi]